MSDEHQEITQLLRGIDAGDDAVVDKLFLNLYEDLRNLAHLHLNRERANHTLNPTALVHEAYIKLLEQSNKKWQNKSHFLGIASLMMRRILIKYARRRQAEKRGGQLQKVTLADGDVVWETGLVDLIALDDALQKLEKIAERPSKIVTMRFFGGLKNDEIAAALNVSVPTVKRDWKTARVWLSEVLGDGGEADEPS